MRKDRVDFYIQICSTKGVESAFELHGRTEHFSSAMNAGNAKWDHYSSPLRMWKRCSSNE